MGNFWMVSPETVQVELECEGRTFWIRVKKELTIGEQRRSETAGFRGVTGLDDGEPKKPGQKSREASITIDFKAQSFARTMAWMEDWSLADEGNNKIKITRDAVEALRQPIYLAIENAISAHVEAIEERKKAEPGADAPSTT